MPASLQQEIRQNKPFHSPSHECAVGLLRTADLLVRHYTTVVSPYDITLQQYNVLRILRGAADAGLPTLEISERMVERTPGITRLLDRLERKGWVRRARNAGDRRQVFCWITAEGLALLSRMDQPIAQADAAGLATLPPAELRELIGLLARLREHLRSLLDDAPGA
jgi:DNA-binding MarR family transcriptional regulator